jgi:hypothetical protein
MASNKKGNLPRDSVADATEVMNRFRHSMAREVERITEATRRMQDALRPSEQLMATARAFGEQVHVMTEEHRKLSSRAESLWTASKFDFGKLNESIAAVDRLLQPIRGFEALLPKVRLDELLGPKLNFDELVSATKVDFEKLIGSRVNFETLLRTQVETERLFNAVQSTLNDTRPLVAPLRERLESAVRAPAAVLSAMAAHAPAEVGALDTGHVLSSEESGADQDLAWNEWLRRLPAHVQFIVLFLVLLVLQPIADAAWSQLVARWLGADKVQDQRVVIEETRNYFGTGSVQSLRCVRARSLRVRESADKKAVVIGSLRAGQSVEVIEVQGSWSLIRYKDQTTGELRQGWAASGYLVGCTC